jgi:hypothetical protein
MIAATTVDAAGGPKCGTKLNRSQLDEAKRIRQLLTLELWCRNVRSAGAAS